MSARSFVVWSFLSLAVVVGCGGVDPSSGSASSNLDERAAQADNAVTPPDVGAVRADGGARDAATDAKPTCSAGGGANGHGLCSSDYQFFQSAEAACASTHGHLTSFKADEKCGQGSSNSFQYTCCSTKPTNCDGGGMMNGNGICSSDGAMFGSAEQSCAAQKRAIAGFSLLNACSSDSAQGATYTCCP
jgi:hypothetical protein